MPEIELRVPKRHQPLVLDLLTSPPEMLDALAGALEESKISSSSTSKLAEQVAERAGIDASKAGDAITLLVSLYYLPENFRSLKRDDLVPRLMAAIAQDSALEAGSEQLDRLREFLERTLSLEDPIGLLSKSVHVRASHERVFGSARIFSDLRPIFGSTPGKPAAATVIHMLQIHYHKGDYGEEAYFALSADDLEELAQMIRRAQEKESELRMLAEGSGVAVLDEER